MAVGRTIAGITQKPEYRIHRGPAVPGINLGSPRGFGNGLCERVRQDILRRTAPKPVREQNPFAANSEEPRSLQSVVPAPAGGRSEPIEYATALGVGPEVGPATETTAALATDPEIAYLTLGSVPALCESESKKKSGGWLAWITGLRPWSRVAATGRALVQEELRLNDVRPLRSRLAEPGAEQTESLSAMRPADRLANPFSMKADVGASVTPEATAKGAGAGRSSGSGAARTMADRLPEWLRRRDRKTDEEFLEA